METEELTNNHPQGEITGSTPTTRLSRLKSAFKKRWPILAAILLIILLILLFRSCKSLPTSSTTHEPGIRILTQQESDLPDNGGSSNTLPKLEPIHNFTMKDKRVLLVTKRLDINDLGAKKCSDPQVQIFDPESETFEQLDKVHITNSYDAQYLLLESGKLLVVGKEYGWPLCNPNFGNRLPDGDFKDTYDRFRWVVKSYDLPSSNSKTYKVTQGIAEGIDYIPATEDGIRWPFIAEVPKKGVIISTFQRSGRGQEEPQEYFLDLNKGQIRLDTHTSGLPITSDFGASLKLNDGKVVIYNHYNKNGELSLFNPATQKTTPIGVMSLGTFQDVSMQEVSSRLVAIYDQGANTKVAYNHKSRIYLLNVDTLELWSKDLKDLEGDLPQRSAKASTQHPFPDALARLHLYEGRIASQSTQEDNYEDVAEPVREGDQEFYLFKKSSEPTNAASGLQSIFLKDPEGNQLLVNEMPKVRWEYVTKSLSATEKSYQPIFTTEGSLLLLSSYLKDLPHSFGIVNASTLKLVERPEDIPTSRGSWDNFGDLVPPTFFFYPYTNTFIKRPILLPSGKVLLIADQTVGTANQRQSYWEKTFGSDWDTVKKCYKDRQEYFDANLKDQPYQKDSEDLDTYNSLCSFTPKAPVSTKLTSETRRYTTFMIYNPYGNYQPNLKLNLNNWNKVELKK